MGRGVWQFNAWQLIAMQSSAAWDGTNSPNCLHIHQAALIKAFITSFQYS